MACQKALLKLKLRQTVKKINPIALAIYQVTLVWRHQSVSNFLKAFWVNLKAYLGLVLPKPPPLSGWFLGNIISWAMPTSSWSLPSTTTVVHDIIYCKLITIWYITVWSWQFHTMKWHVAISNLKCAQISMKHAIIRSYQYIHPFHKGYIYIYISLRADKCTAKNVTNCILTP